MPRVPPQTAYTALATRMALLYYGINAKMPPPASTAHYGKMDGKHKRIRQPVVCVVKEWLFMPGIICHVGIFLMMRRMMKVNNFSILFKILVLSLGTLILRRRQKA